MINNYWEDLEMSNKLKAFHNSEVEMMRIPNWIDLHCPFCKEKCEPRSIRSIGMNFNARNIGDVTVEFCCDKSNRMDTLYYRKAALDVKDFSDLINPNCTEDIKPPNEPLIEEKMYKMQYNNLVERMIHKEN